MRRAHLLAAAILLLLPACSTAGPSLRPGAWRLGLALDVWDDTTLNDADVDQDVITADIGKILGPSSEFGLRLVSGDMPDVNLDYATIGPYYRWYFVPDSSVRPWIDVGIGFAGIDNGTDDGSGWEFSAAAGVAWYVITNLGLEAFVRTARGNYQVEDVYTTQIGLGLSYLW